MSSLYLYGRPQDIGLQKARDTVDERNHLRLWLSPLRYQGQEVWVGQISRDIGVRLSRKTFVTHEIDPEVDEARGYIVQDLILSQNVEAVAFVKGVGEAHKDEPRYNYTLSPYFTDGLRAVMFTSTQPVSLTEIDFFDWEHPPQDWD
ncbi:MAG: LssY C-terminal domain-containing protein [Planctomycetota bacterium]|nr:LssY C-terminal domain-containing protein [Planctomycetota bacterium]